MGENMKKIFAIAAVLVMGTAGMFALDLKDIQGTWQDSNWTFNADGKIVLTKASSGETVFTFDDSNVQKFKILPTTSGLSISFDCEETERSYKFTKPITLNADLDMHIDPKWTSEGYDVKIKFQK